MAKFTNPAERAKKAKEYQCLKIVEGLMRGDTKTADKYLQKLVEKRISNKMSYILKSDNLI